MRSLLLGLTLITAAACTRPNPDAVGGSGHDLATPPLNGGGRDLATVAPRDLSLPSQGGGDDLSEPRDLAFGPGVRCGSTTCEPPTGVCCLDNNSERCTAANGCNNGGSPLVCDGPEDCTMFGSAVCCGTTGGGTPRTTCRFTCSGGEAPMCHDVSDCPTFGGFVACCPRAGTTLARCSTTQC
jgi:hypothetical protein